MPPRKFLPLRRRNYQRRQAPSPPPFVPPPLILLLGIFSFMVGETKDRRVGLATPAVSAFCAAPKITAAPAVTAEYDDSWSHPSVCGPRLGCVAKCVDQRSRSRHRSRRRRGHLSTSTTRLGSSANDFGPNGESSPSSRTLPAQHEKDEDEEGRLETFLMGLASAHSISAALRVCVRLGLPDVLSYGGALDGAAGGGDPPPPMTVEKVASAIERRSSNKGAGRRDGVGVGRQQQRRGAPASATAGGMKPSPNWGVRRAPPPPRTGGVGIIDGGGATSLDNRRPDPPNSYSTSLPSSEPLWDGRFRNSPYGSGTSRPRPGGVTRPHARTPNPEPPREVEVGEKVNRDALLRIMRLLASVGILYEEVSTSTSVIPSEHPYSKPKSKTEVERRFGLTRMGTLLRTETGTGHRIGDSLAPLVEHWTERPMWDAWLELPAYVAGVPSTVGFRSGDATKTPPFDRANGGTSAGRYYSEEDGSHPESSRQAADFRRYSSDRELEAVLNGFDWDGQLSGRTVVHVGGGRGDVMRRVARRFPRVNCLSLDLPEVVGTEIGGDPLIDGGIQLVGGDAFDPSTIPVSDAVFMMHFLDRRRWTDEEAARILRSCHEALGRFGRVILGEAVLPDDASDVNDGGGGAGRMRLVTDAMLVLVGQAGQRTETDWRNLASEAGFAVESINPTRSPGCYIIVLAKASPSSQDGVMEAITTRGG